MHRSTTRRSQRLLLPRRTRCPNSFRVLPQKRAGKPVASMLAEHIASSNPSLARETTLSSGKRPKGGSASTLVPGAELGGLSAVILLQSSCRYSSRFKSANVLLIRAMRYKLADSCGMQRQNLAETTQNTGNRRTKD
jgi:hypothetical protein